MAFSRGSSRKPSSRQKAKADRALAVRIDVLSIDLHLGAVMDHALDHRGHLRRGRRLELRVDAQGVSLDVPVDHDAAPAVAHMPLGGEILVPGAVVLRIGGASGGARSPNSGISGLKRAVGNGRDGSAQRIDADIAAPDIRQILRRHTRFQARHALQPGIGAEPVQAQEQPRLQHRALKGFVGGRTLQHVGKAQPQIGFLDHVEQSRHGPRRIEFRLERLQGGRIGLVRPVG